MNIHEKNQIADKMAQLSQQLVNFHRELSHTETLFGAVVTVDDAKPIYDKQMSIVLDALSDLLYAATERDKKNRIRQFDEFVDQARKVLNTFRPAVEASEGIRGPVPGVGEFTITPANEVEGAAEFTERITNEESSRFIARLQNLTEAGVIQAPTLEQPKPVEAEAIPDATQGAQDALMKEFIGPTSLFAKYLSPSVYPGARGVLKADDKTLPQYVDDLRHIDPRFVPCWHNGFYRNSETKAPQFLVVLEPQKMAVYFDPSPEERLSPMYIVVDGEEAHRQEITRLSYGHMLMLREKLTAKLQDLFTTYNQANPV